MHLLPPPLLPNSQAGVSNISPLAIERREHDPDSGRCDCYGYDNDLTVAHTTKLHWGWDGLGGSFVDISQTTDSV